MTIITNAPAQQPGVVTDITVGSAPAQQDDSDIFTAVSPSAQQSGQVVVGFAFSTHDFFSDVVNKAWDNLTGAAV
eukprot:CAMPEP_0172162666 /NCGR_PEP_ID=MMETSP1050-20130122/6807_1 /TAXON_ID=233186 /ORGANISM="Cryptomonas curvata, Strain CCAP979/52" /LENGTH=74 /DNA_ID=CAMNT_0012832699 /DNA_START=806 /DNA_END=1030 /DNA_ORIENTATION=-